MAVDTRSLLTIPPEVRLQIYRLALPFSTYESALEPDDCPVRWHKGLCPNILFVNRQIHQEASELLYKKNFFAIYMRHPDKARLPMNESRPDPQSFVLFSWKHNYWAHPRNQRVPVSAILKHSNLLDISKVYLSVPSLDGPIGVDAYVRRSSHARFYGVGNWLEQCTNRDGLLISAEEERMRYVYRYKDAFDEIGNMLNTLPHLGFLSVGVNVSLHIITFLGFLMERILSLGNIPYPTCYYIPSRKSLSLLGPACNEHTILKDPLTRSFERILLSDEGIFVEPIPRLSKEANDMNCLLHEIRIRQSLQSLDGKGPSCLNPADIICQ